MRRVMVIDLDICIGCRSCVVACKTHNSVTPGNWWNKIIASDGAKHLFSDSFERSFFIPIHCQHCQDAPCVKACPVDATYVDKDGMVLTDFNKCIGCKYCISACPYEVPQFNSEDPIVSYSRYMLEDDYRYGMKETLKKNEGVAYFPSAIKGTVDKCNFCVHYFEKKIEPACQRACPVQAIKTGDHEDETSEISRLIKEEGGITLLPEKNTRPNVYFLLPGRSKQHD